MNTIKKGRYGLSMTEETSRFQIKLKKVHKNGRSDLIPNSRRQFLNPLFQRMGFMSVLWLARGFREELPTISLTEEEVVMVLCWITCCWEQAGTGLSGGLFSGLKYPCDSFCMAVIGQSLCVSNSCLSCATSFFNMDTSF